MRPFTIYHTHLNLFTSSKERLVELVQQVIMPDVIYLLGATLNRQRAESIFNQTAPTGQFINNYYLLVLINETQGRPLHEWQEMIEQKCDQFAETVVIILKTKTFNEWLETGHRFARLVEQNALKLLVSENVLLSEIGEYDEEKESIELEHILERGKYMASEFLSGAEIYIARENYNLAAFMIHQALEQALSTMVTVKTGYQQRTHNIKRLMRYGGLISWELITLSDSFTIENSIYIDKISNIYYEARYFRSTVFKKPIIEKMYAFATHVLAGNY